jgi:hypothetical protein
MKNKAMAIKAIKQDCLIQLEYINEMGQTCPIGRLALESGVRKRTLEKAGSDSISTKYSISRPITKKFGIPLRDQMWIQRLNDTIHSLPKRRSRIVAFLKTL